MLTAKSIIMLANRNYYFRITALSIFLFVTVTAFSQKLDTSIFSNKYEEQVFNNYFKKSEIDTLKLLICNIGDQYLKYNAILSRIIQNLDALGINEISENKKIIIFDLEF